MDCFVLLVKYAFFGTGYAIYKLEKPWRAGNSEEEFTRTVRQLKCYWNRTGLRLFYENTPLRRRSELQTCYSLHPVVTLTTGLMLCDTCCHQLVKIQHKLLERLKLKKKRSRLVLLVFSAKKKRGQGLQFRCFQNRRIHSTVFPLLLYILV